MQKRITRNVLTVVQSILSRFGRILPQYRFSYSSDNVLLSQKILDSMEDTCPKCDRIITKGSKLAHSLTDCPNERISCPNEECGITELRCYMTNHLEKCPYSLIHCLCGHSMMLKDFIVSRRLSSFRTDRTSLNSLIRFFFSHIRTLGVLLQENLNH